MDASNSAELEVAARAYLAEQLGPRAPQVLTYIGLFDEHALEGEGPTALFAFDLEPSPEAARRAGAAALRRHYVAVGQTEPNFFPAYGLDADDAYSFHVGTRFMLVMDVALVDAAEEPPAARHELHALMAAAAPRTRVASEELAALFRCGEQLFAVYRLTLDSGEQLYCLGADCPPGFYRLTEHPPQVTLRLYLGKLIRAEAGRETTGRHGGQSALSGEP